MLIIFDLDDTLIDTSGAVTPFKLKECFLQLVKSGVKCHDVCELLALNDKAEKSKIALVEFAKSYQANETQIQEALKVLSSPLPDSFRIPVTPYAHEILKFFRSRCDVALVSAGEPSYQMDKLKKAGIEPSIFCMIALPEDSVKKPHYQALQKKLNILPTDIWVCGDRIDVDLCPANELGFNTVHMRWGRGKSLKTEEWVKYSVNNLHSLKEIIR